MTVTAAAGPARFTCAYCGTVQDLRGTGAAVCRQCGATQPKVEASAAARPPRRWGRRLVWLVLLLAVAGGGYAYYRHLHPPAQPKPAAAATPPAVEPSRIVRVDNPRIRIIPKDFQYNTQDLLDTAGEKTPPFDTAKLVVKPPRRMKDEEENIVFLGEITNTSPDQVAIAPQLTLSIVRGGKTIDSATHAYPDLAPGARVPLFFRYDGDGEPPQYDSMQFTWQPAASYALGATHRPKLTATVGHYDIQRGQTEENFSAVYYYKLAHVVGTVRNEGQGAAKNIVLFVVLRDAKGQMTGYMRHNMGMGPDGLPPGADTKFDLDVTQWGDPITAVEAWALPTSLPGY